MSRLLSCVVLLACLTVGATELRVSGIIGQSQPVGEAPISSVGMNGAVMDSAGQLWSLAAGQLYGFSQAGESWRVTTACALPAGGRLPLLGEGRQLWLRAGDAIWTFACDTGTFAKVVALPPACQSFSLGLGEYRFIALAADTVYGWSAGAWQRLFAVSAPAEGGRNSAICVEPHTGDILVGSEYPTMLVRRFQLDGAEIIGQTWPRRAFSRWLCVADGVAWTLNAKADSLPEPLITTGDVREVGGEWSQPASGIAVDDNGRYWLATDHGLLGYDHHSRPLGIRLGGIAGVRQMVVDDDCNLYATIADRLIRIPIDAGATTPLTSKESKFRFGENYRSHSGGLQWNGAHLLMLDTELGALWQFDPSQLGWWQKSWQRLTDEQTFTQPEALALGEQRVFVLDGGRVRLATAPDFTQWQDLSIAPPVGGLAMLAARHDDQLLCASERTVAAYRIDADGKAAPDWQSQLPFATIAALTANDGCVAVAERDPGRVTLLDARDGSLVAQLTATAVPGGMRPAAICLKAPWVFVHDEAGQRIIRLRIVETTASR